MVKALGFMEAARIQSEINRLFENLLDAGSGGEPGGAWIPNADILETGERLLLQVELPGVAAEDLSIRVDSGNVILEGTKRAPEDEAGFAAGAPEATVERQFGSFRRTIALGVPVNTRQAEAVLRDGLLRVDFPKVPNRRGEVLSIEVKSP